MVKNLVANAGARSDWGSIPGSGRSPVWGHGNPLQCSCLENPMDRGAWRAAVHGVTQSQTRLKWLSMPACAFFGGWQRGRRIACIENCLLHQSGLHVWSSVGMCVVGKEGSKATALKEPKSCNVSSRLRASVPFRAPLVAQMVKNLPVMQETRVWSLGQGRSPGE